MSVVTASGSSQGDGPTSIGAQLRSGALFDVVILNTTGLADLMAQGRIVKGSERRLAQVLTGLGVRAGSAALDIGQRIPQDLWAGAVVAATVHGAYRVSAELHLDYNVLKRRAALAGGKVPGTELTPRFVELFAAPGATKSATLLPQYVVEIDNTRGAKMRVQLGGDGLAGLSILCNAFWAAR